MLEEVVIVDGCRNSGLGNTSVRFLILFADGHGSEQTHSGNAGMYVSGNTTKSARLLAASRINETVFWTVLAVSRKIGATLQAIEATRQSKSLMDALCHTVSNSPATLIFGSQGAIAAVSSLFSSSLYYYTDDHS